jgi:hypothetical protein
MAENSELAWRKALDRKGRDWVTAELRRRPGQPEDVVLDIVFEEPYPTRAFCQRWCAEQDNRMFSLSGYTIALIVTAVLLLAFTIKLVVSWDNVPELQHQQTDR